MILDDRDTVEVPDLTGLSVREAHARCKAHGLEAHIHVPPPVPLFRRFRQITKARFKRWAYLLFVGMWRGECAVTLYDNDGIKAIGSGVPTGQPGIFRNFKIFWERR